MCEIRRVWSSFAETACNDDNVPDALRARLGAHSTDNISHPSFMITLQQAEIHYQNRHKTMHNKSKNASVQSWRHKMMLDRTHACAYQYAKQSNQQPVTALQDPDTGEVTTHPTRLDHIMRKTWGAIYEGNVSNHMEGIANYLHEYA